MILLTDKQISELDKFEASEPIPLRTANLREPFVYYRKYGVFYVPSGRHSFVIATLMAFDKECDSLYGLMKTPNYKHCDGPQDLAHIFMEETEGLAYKSSLDTDNVRCWQPKFLTNVEKRIFGYVEYIGD